MMMKQARIGRQIATLLLDPSPEVFAMSSRRPPASRIRRPRLEALEPRRLLATFLVTTAADGGAGSLRAAILEADADGSAGVDEIDFKIAGSGLRTISPTTVLPTITRPVFLDGESEPGYSGTPLILLDGGSEPAGTDGLTISGGSSKVEGLQVNDFAPAHPQGDVDSTGGRGIYLTGAGGDLIAADVLGLISNVNATFGNGIGVEVDAPDVTIGGTGALGDVIGGNSGSRAYIPSRDPVVGTTPAPGDTSVTGDGIAVDAVSGVVIRGNRIGEAAGAPDRLENSGDGIGLIGAIRPVIGGSDAGDGNVIAGSYLNGIYMDAQMEPGDFMGATIQGNDIGVEPDANGYFDQANDGAGIFAQAAGNTIGGTTSGEANVVGANSGIGILVEPIDASGNPLASGGDNLIEGNFVGIGPGDAKLPANGVEGIAASGGGTIGGTVPGAGNVVSNNGFYIGSRDAKYGILADGYTIQGNKIGTNVEGTTAEANDGGGLALRGSDTVGGSTFGAGNLISGNDGPGIDIDSEASHPIGTIIIQGNKIGTNYASGPLANEGDGIDAPDTYPDATAPTASGTVLIGGPDAGDGNAISGNLGTGIRLGGNGNLDPLGAVTIQGNQIGASDGGMIRVPNGGAGIALFSSVSPVTIGGTATGAGNTIADNDGIGVVETFAGDPIVGNAVFGNATAKTIHGGPQIAAPSYTRYTPPTLTSAIIQGNNVTLFGTFAGVPGEVRTFDFFASQTGTIDQSGAGGQVYLGTARATVNPSGQGTIRVTYPIPAPPTGVGPGASAYTVYTATATYAHQGTPTPGGLDNFGGTSAFSNPVTSQPETAPFTDIALALVSSPPAGENPSSSGSYQFTVTNTGTNPALAVTLNELFPLGGLLSATTSIGSIAFTPRGNFVASLNTLAPGDSDSITIRVSYATTTSGGSFLAEGLVTSLTADRRRRG